MRHRNKGNKLGRNEAHRKALLKNLASSLFLHGSITTTLAKAKAVRPYAEKIITRAIKAQSAGQAATRIAHMRNIEADIQEKGAFNSVINVWAVLCMGRPGGYTRIIKLGRRLGDAAEMALISIVMDRSDAENYGLTTPDRPEKIFTTVSKELLKSRLPGVSTLEQWVEATLPQIEVTASVTRSKRSLNFKISFINRAGLGEFSWPKYKDKYLELPLKIQIDSVPANLGQSRESDAAGEMKYSYDAKNIMFIASNPTPNVVKVRFSPWKQEQSLSGKISVTGENARISGLGYCQLIIYGPVGRIYSGDLLKIKNEI